MKRSLLEQGVQPKPKPLKVRLPGFVSDKEIGLGDVIKRATSVVGIRQCHGCARRAEILNLWIVFRRW
jgi:hypothetical protein